MAGALARGGGYFKYSFKDQDNKLFKNYFLSILENSINRGLE